jgi:hypothetical protein
MGEIGNWLLAIVAVGLLAGATLLFARYIGGWIDSQGNSVVGKPREERRLKTPGDSDEGDGGA